MILLLSSFLPTFADTAFNGKIDETHWAYSLAQSLEARKILLEDDPYQLGEAITYNQFVSLLNRIDSSFEIPKLDKDKTITRQEAVVVIAGLYHYDSIIKDLAKFSLPYTDVNSHIAEYKMALDFGIITPSSNGRFRPNDSLKFEEALAMIYHVDRLHLAKPEALGTYYAISSYSQIDMIKDVNYVIYGWSRLEYSAATNQILLNSTSENKNEYKVPLGYSEAITAADKANAKKYLMVSLKDDIITIDNKSVKLSDYIFQSTDNLDKVVSKIVVNVENNAQDIPYDGVLIDFEGFKGQDKAKQFNLFLSSLKVRLDFYNADLLVAVQPVRKAGIAYYDGYDFKSIGRLADYVILMAHDYAAKQLTQDEMDAGMSITPLAPINEIYYALEAITDSDKGVQDKSKIIIQFSMDSAQWKLQDGKIINSRPYTPTYSAIADRIKKGEEPTYSTDLESPYLVYYNEEDQTRNMIWYEDSRSIDAKIDLSLKFGIKNFSFWRLGTIPNDDSVAYFDIWNHIIEKYYQ